MVQVHSGLPNLHGKFEEVLTTCYGAIAQLGERLLCTQEVSQLSYSPIVVKSRLTLISVEARRGDAKHTEVCERRRNAASAEIW